MSTFSVTHTLSDHNIQFSTLSTNSTTSNHLPPQESQELSETLKKIEQVRQFPLKSTEPTLTNQPIIIKKRKTILDSGSPSNYQPAQSPLFPTPISIPKLKLSMLPQELEKSDSKPKNPSSQKIPPASPFKRKQGQSNSIFHKMATHAEKGSIMIQNKLANLSKIGEGSYMTVYTLEAPDLIVEDAVSNDQLVVKVFTVKQSTQSSNAVLSSYMTSSIINYQEADRMGLNVARIYNHETAVKEGFFLQEKIPYPIDINKIAHMQQVCIFFLASLKNKMILDLLPDNLRVRENGTVTLIDFVEDKSDGLYVFIRHALVLWTERFAQRHDMNYEKTKQFLTDFTKDFDQYGYPSETNQEILNRVFVT